MDLSDVNFYETFQAAWAEGLLWCSAMGFLGFELMKLRTHKGREEVLKAMPLPAYILVALFFGAIISIIAALATIVTESNFLNAIFYGFLLPSAGSRWLALERDRGNDTDFESDETTFEQGRAVRFSLARRFQLALFGARA